MVLYILQSNNSLEDHWSDQLWYFIRAVCTLALYNTQLGIILCIFANLDPRIVRRVPFLTETFTVLSYYTDKSLSCIRIRQITNIETFGKFVPILCMTICNNIIPGVWLLINIWVKYRFTIMIIIKGPVFNAIYTVKGAIFYICSLWSFAASKIWPPWAFTPLNQIILQKIISPIHSDIWFMRSVPWQFPTHRWR